MSVSSSILVCLMLAFCQTSFNKDLLTLYEGRLCWSLPIRTSFSEWTSFQGNSSLFFLYFFIVKKKLFIYNKIFDQIVVTINFAFAILVVMFMTYLFLPCLCHTSSSCHVYAIPLLVFMFMPFLFLLSSLCHTFSCCHIYAEPLPVVRCMPCPLSLLCLIYTSSCCHVYAIPLLVTMFMPYLLLIPCLCCTSFISSFQTQCARQSKIFSLPINQGKSFWR